MTNESEELAQIVRAASARPEVLAAVRTLYASVQREIDARRPICVVSGRCCRFEEYGHRLFVTTMELATFLNDLDLMTEARRAPFMPMWNGEGCPFQASKLCQVHAIRPFGCRMFFCDTTSTDWQNQTYERFHAELRRSHESLGVPYRYLEWRVGLQAIGSVSSKSPSASTELLSDSADSF